MKRIYIFFAILVIVSIINIEIKLHAQPKISKEKIPKSIPVDVRKQIERLYSSFPEERGYAAVSLSKMGSRAAPAIPFLISILNDNTTLEWQRLGGFEKTSPAKEAAKALGKIKDSRAVEPLILRLKDKDAVVRSLAAMALGEIKDTRAVKPLIAALKDKHAPHIVIGITSSAKALGKFGTTAVEPLIAALKDKDRYVRRGAAEALGYIKDSRAVEPLIAAMKDKANAAMKDKANIFIRCSIAAALGKIKDSRAVEVLIARLKDNDWMVRWSVAKALGYIRDKRAVKPLITALKDNDWNVRASAALALGEIRDTRAVGSLIAALKDNYSGVRKNAGEALDKLGFDPKNVKQRVILLIHKKNWDECIKIGKPAVEPLIAALKNNNDEMVRMQVASALGEIKDIRAVEPLIAALKDKDAYVRAYAASALGKIKDPRVVTILITALKDKHAYVRQLAVTALGKIKDTRAVMPLIVVLKDEDAQVRKSAAEVLGEIKDSRAVEPLIAALKDKSRPVRSNAAKALGKINDSRAVEPLVTALKDNYWDVRWNVAEALERSGWNPENVKQRVIFFINKRKWNECIKIGKPAVTLLISALKDSRNAYIRRDAANALGKINDIRAVEPLIEALKDRRGNVRASAAAALKRITGEEFAIDYDGWFKWWQENKDKCQQR